MATLTVGHGAGYQYQTLASAVAAAQNGDVVTVQAGTYNDDFATINTDITIIGVGGLVTLDATAPLPENNSKAILIVNTNATIENIAFTGAATLPGLGENGAGIRYQGGNLVISNCYFYGNQEGLLANADQTGSITINNSEFADNGVASGSAGSGYAHNLYVNQINQLTINNSYFYDPIVGHDIKSRALNTTIENSRIVDPNGTGSYEIDLPNGGNGVISNNVIEKAPGSQNNPVMIAFGEEGGVAGSSLSVTGNTFINNYGPATVVWNNTSAIASVTDNTIYGLTSSGQLVNGPATVPNNTSLPLSEAPPLGTSPPYLPIVPPPCFTAGTHILTGDGQVPVEALRIGQEIVVDQSGELVSRPVKWIGWRSLDLATHPTPELVCPIRIRRDAFADGVPQRDLLVSPDHGIFADGILIPARLLVNGGTIEQDMTTSRVWYYHVELAAHSVILAEGLPCESYLDTGNRSLFSNAGAPVALYPAFAVSQTALRWQTDACAPLATSAAAVEPVWRRLADRSAELGLPLPRVATTSDPDLRLVVDPGGPVERSVATAIRPVFAGANKFAFVLPDRVTTVRILSRWTVPAVLTPATDDRRRLGVSIHRIILERGADRHEMAVDDPALRAGWWDVEREGTKLWRWTNGSAVLRLPEGTQRLELQIAAGMCYPAEDVASRGQSAAA